MPDKFDKATRSKTMSKIRATNTQIEIQFRKKMYQDGLRGYRINPKMYGKPDIIFPKYKIAIFLDGDFWHGYNWINKGKVPPKEYWQEKIQRNIARDQEVTGSLISHGWHVLRFWEHEVINDINLCISQVKAAIQIQKTLIIYNQLISKKMSVNLFIVSCCRSKET